MVCALVKSSLVTISDTYKKLVLFINIFKSVA